MKRLYFSTAIALLLWGALAQAQSLGEIAKRQREEKHPAASKVYTNENLPRDGAVNVVGAAVPESLKTAQPSSPGQAQAGDAAGENKPANPKNGAQPEEPGDPKAGTASPADKDKTADGLKASIVATQKQIDDLTHELDLMNREFRLRAATYYADAGNSLRDPAKWAEERRQYDAQVQEKQKALDAAKQKLSDLQEQARQAGVAVP